MSPNKVQHPCILFPCSESKLKPQTTVSLKYILVLNVPSTYPYATLPVFAKRSVCVPFLEFHGLGTPAGRHRQPRRCVHRPHPCRAPAVLPLRDAVDRVAQPQRHRPHRAPGLCRRQVGALLVMLAGPGRGVELMSTIRRRHTDLVADGVLDDAAASEEDRALAAKVVGLYLAQEVQRPSASRTKHKRRVRSYSDAEDDEDDSADNDEPSEQEYSPPKSPAPISRPLHSAPNNSGPLSPPPPAPHRHLPSPNTTLRQCNAPPANLRPSRLSVRTSSKTVQRKRVLQQQLLLVARSPMDKLRDEYQNYYMEVTAHLAGTVFHLDEAQRHLRALRLAWHVKEDAEPRHVGEDAEPRWGT
ncbi:hypothetical protein C8J57DRAFT_1584762 [Mycena rebaudengoi]|nr:hypothetical protein C8J57DRAFT_1584762 [Mycena rebaudengoi]